MRYFTILSISPTTDKDIIKKSYRRMATKWHPDKHNNSKEANEKFIKIKEAYENCLKYKPKDSFTTHSYINLQNQSFDQMINDRYNQFLSRRGLIF